MPIGNGVCGAAAQSGKTEIVGDVTKDPRYLACFAGTKSEIVVPIFADGRVVGEIDIDGTELNAFTREDQAFLEDVAALLAPLAPRR
ncbi:MAG: GAF domain-containing protein [Armatimonadetes bacterium]|nr:GAF domain-containing protein [Armatimonadota bacterium]